MAANNYFGFAHGGTQYGTATAGAAYAGGQTGYAVAPAPTAATYGTQRAAAAGYDTAYQAAATQGTYAVMSPAAGAQAGTYQLAYGRTAAAAAQQTYDASKTAYYQQAAAAAAAYPAQQQPAYEAAAAKPAYTTTPNYAQGGAARAAQPAKATQYGSTYGQGSAAAVAAYPSAQAYATSPAATQHATPPAKQTAATNSTTYSGYDAALYSAATMYVAQQNKGGGGSSGAGTGWQGYKKGGNAGGARLRPKQPPKPQQLHYCDVCRISCAGPQTYREHLEGQKHKKKEASMKVSAATGGNSTPAAPTSGRGSSGSLRCELCDVTCTGGDAYAAHVRGIKHQKVVKLHTRLGKPIPSQEPKIIGGEKTTTVSGTTKIKFVSSGGLSTVGNPESTSAGEDSMVDDAGEPEPEIQPVGQDYIEEIKGDDGKVLSFNCKLCDCRFNDPNAKEMHMKGRRHRLQYKKKVQPDLIVDVKPSLRQRKIPGQKMQRMIDEMWARRRLHKCEMEEEERLYWEERRRFNEECDYMDWCRRSGPPLPPPPHAPHALRPPPPMLPPFAPHPPMPHFIPPPGHRPESLADRHVIARHSEIYPGEEELQTIQRVVSHTERALKSVSDFLSEQAMKQQPKKLATPVSVKTEKPVEKPATPVVATATAVTATAVIAATDIKKEEGENKEQPKEDGRDNQLFSFLQEGEGTTSSTTRLLKGVMRVGLMAKGLLLKGDRAVRLVVLCSDKPTVSLLKRVSQELPQHLLKVTNEYKYKVELCPAEGGVTITDGSISVLVSLTSPVMREPNDVGGSADAPKRDDKDVLPRQKCLDALASLRHAKWFQARASGLQSCVMTIRIMRDLCRRIPTWTPLNAWAMELLVEKVASSAGVPLSPGECLRRVMEAVAGGLLLENGPGLLDPCEKDHKDALGILPPQKREDLTASAQQFLRQIAFKQIHKVLDMEPLPPPWLSRKRRRSNTETEGEGKMVKTEEKMDTTEIGNE